MARRKLKPLQHYQRTLYTRCWGSLCRYLVYRRASHQLEVVYLHRLMALPMSVRSRTQEIRADRLHRATLVVMKCKLNQRRRIQSLNHAADAMAARTLKQVRCWLLMHSSHNPRLAASVQRDCHKSVSMSRSPSEAPLCGAAQRRASPPDTDVEMDQVHRQSKGEENSRASCRLLPKSCERVRLG